MIGAAGPLIVIEVVTWPKSTPANSSVMSERLSTATPARPTSPIAHSWSESRPSRVGMSKAVDRPVLPAASSSWKRALVSAAVPKPAKRRIVQLRLRYIDAWMPRV